MSTPLFSPRLMAAVARIGVVALGALSATASWGQDKQPIVVPDKWTDEFLVSYVKGECMQTLSVPNTQARSDLNRVNIAYNRSEGCQELPLVHEMKVMTAAFAALMTKIPDRARVTGFFLGRVVQPEFRIRIANASLAHQLTTLPNASGFHRRLRSAMEEADVFKELRELFDAHGFLLSVASLERIERSREIDLIQWRMDSRELVQPLPENARIPVGAIVWFDLKEK